MSEKLKVYFFGYGGHAYRAENLRPLINELGMDLVTIHEGHGDIKPDILWDRRTYLKELNNADIIILPADFDKWPAKSCNKLTQSLSLGKPVVCSLQDSYVAVEEKFPGCCIFARSQEDWKNALVSLRDNQSLREKISIIALEASKHYSIDSIGEKWLDLLENSDKVDIVIPTYNNLPCLKLCIDSIRECTRCLYNIIVVNNGPDENVHKYLEQQNDIVYIRKGRLRFAQAINIGIWAGSSKYVCLLNDDTIVSYGWLSDLVATTRHKNDAGLVGVLSNCDKGWLHNKDINIGGVNLLPGQNTLDQINPIIHNIYEYDSPWKEEVEKDWVAFYATLIPRRVINDVGILNEKFINSGEDVDYCRRARKMGYNIYQNYQSFVFHFGAVGRKILEKEDKDSFQSADRETQRLLRDIWDRETVVLYSGPSWERWDFRSLDSGGIGGSETWQVSLAREFSNLGYRVISFCDCPEQGIRDGDIEYLHYSSYNDWIEQNWIDYFITSRTTDTLRLPVRAGKIFVMIHDVWLLSGKDQVFLDRVDKYCVLSDWHWKFVKDYHGIPDEKLHLTSNGMDFARFYIKGVERNPYRLMYSSSPDRGLDTLLYLFDFIKSEVTEAELHIFYGFENWSKSILQKNDKVQIEKMEKIKEAMNKPGVCYHGRVGQSQLAEEWLKTSLWAYPTDFEEVFCITAIEAQRAGVPVVTSNYAGLQTTLGDSACLIGSGNKGESYTKLYRENFVRCCIEVLTDNRKWRDLSEKGLRNSEKYSWKNVAQDWNILFKGTV